MWVEQTTFFGVTIIQIRIQLQNCSSFLISESDSMLLQTLNTEMNNFEKNVQTKKGEGGSLSFTIIYNDFTR